MRTRRSATRRDVTVPCQAIRLRDFRLVADRTLDVSTTGILLPLGDVPVSRGDRLLVTFAIPGMRIDAVATVTRVVQNRRPNDDGLAVGVELESLPEPARVALERFLRGRPPPLPRRGPLSRMRRGAPAPRLADHDTMQHFERFADERDVQDDESEDEGLSALRRVVQAWRQLGVG